MGKKSFSLEIVVEDWGEYGSRGSFTSAFKFDERMKPNPFSAGCRLVALIPGLMGGWKVKGSLERGPSLF